MDADLIVRHIVSGFVVVDADWMVRAANPKACSLLRRPVQEIQGQRLWDLLPGLQGGNGELELRAARGSRLERRFEYFSPSLYNWFEMWAVAASPDELYVFFLDVSDRARAIQSDAVREALRRILMDAPVAISITRGADHRYELLNHAARALVGGRDLEGMTARNALPEVDPSLFAMIDDVYRSGKPVTLRDLQVTYDREGDGRLYTGTFDVTYLPMRGSDGGIEGLIQTAVETTTFADARRTIESTP